MDECGSLSSLEDAYKDLLEKGNPWLAKSSGSGQESEPLSSSQSIPEYIVREQQEAGQRREQEEREKHLEQLNKERENDRPQLPDNKAQKPEDSGLVVRHTKSLSTSAVPDIANPWAVHKVQKRIIDKTYGSHQSPHDVPETTSRSEGDLLQLQEQPVLRSKGGSPDKANKDAPRSTRQSRENVPDIIITTPPIPEMFIPGTNAHVIASMGDPNRLRPLEQSAWAPAVSHMRATSADPPRRRTRVDNLKKMRPQDLAKVPRSELLRIARKSLDEHNLRKVLDKHRTFIGGDTDLTADFEARWKLMTRDELLEQVRIQKGIVDFMRQEHEAS